MRSYTMKDHPAENVVALDAHEEELLFSRMPMQMTVPIEVIRAQPNAGAAFALACHASGLSDKEIYSHIDIDQGYFSNIKSGKATLQADKEAAFCRRVGNMIYPEWRANQLGCTLTVQQTEAERKLIRAEQENHELRRELDSLRSLIQSKLAA